MFEILNKQILAEDVKRVDIYAPQIARKVRPGQFVSICPEEGDERIPLTVVETDEGRSTIALIFQEKGDTTGKLGSLPIHESVFSILGPLGQPAKIEKCGLVVCIATGVGSAQMLPIARAYRKEGNKIIGIIGAKTKLELMLEAQMRIVSNKIFITTNDGSYERRGVVTDVLKEIIAKEKVGLIYAIGAIDMMQEVVAIAKQKNIPAKVQLNPVMVDCMGMCGACRVKIAGELILACTDGPEFDGHKVDFEDFKVRMNALKESDKCRSHKLQHNKPTEGSTILTKFLSVFRGK
ncbi:MAG: sulfide/dihydroorotate dehydrogenase-like FAD/NAD-binding protein [Candidatus Omnitrophica bacterium]|nr:sulfide/dihydroorotate dehydrogenase-like FAD/NAD-binding protein [Candidatus Omnitrophota bacterium]